MQSAVAHHIRTRRLGPARATATLVPLVALVVAALVTPAAARASAGPDIVTARGFDFATYAPARVIGGRGGNNLELTYTARHTVPDATLTVTLPRAQWPTSLTAVGALFWSERSPLGQVAVRPEVDLPVPGIDPAPACRWVGSKPGPDDLYQVPRAAIRRFPDRQLIVVRHVTCAPGDQLRILATGLRASAVGSYRLPIEVSGGDGSERRSAAVVEVVAPPAPVRLRITVPRTTWVGLTNESGMLSVPDVTDLAVRITAVHPDGTVATGFRDAVGITDTDDPCSTLDLERRLVAHRFTAADRGVAEFTLAVPTTFAYHNSVRLRSWDASHGARAGTSNVFTISAHVAPGVVVDDADPGFVCTSPVSYH